MLLSTIAAVAQVEDNIWEREENKAVEIKAEESPQARNESAVVTDGRKGVLKVSVGPSMTTSKMYYSESDYLSKVFGYEVAVNYEHPLGDHGWGMSVDVDYNYTPYDYIPNISLLHIGAGVVYSEVLKRVRLSAQLGIGVCNCEEKARTGYDSFNVYSYPDKGRLGFSMSSRLGIEYMLSRKVGIGIDFASFRCFMSNDSGYDLPDNEYYGIAHIAALLGVRFYY